ncbi:MAG TPA: hypothetical protein VMH40_22230 [Myxococcaceae bacterium]|nr:hypothetical protein [Myxococcaceae bacterium]
MVWFYRLWVLATLGLFLWGSATGARMYSAPHQRIDPSVRSSPGGYRSYHFWHSGISGGK